MCLSVLDSRTYGLRTIDKDSRLKDKDLRSKDKDFCKLVLEDKDKDFPRTGLQ